MQPERLKQLANLYRREVAASRDTILAALRESYKDITGKEPSERLEEKLADALEYYGD